MIHKSYMMCNTNLSKSIEHLLYGSVKVICMLITCRKRLLLTYHYESVSRGVRFNNKSHIIHMFKALMNKFIPTNCEYNFSHSSKMSS